MAGDPSMISFGSMDSRAMSITSEDDVTSEHSTESFSSKGNRLTMMSLRYKWVSHWEFIAFAISFAFRIENCFTIPHRSENHDGNIFHYTVLYIVFGLPAVYMQVVIGQYSQLGVTFMKHLIPIGHGLSYILCINALIDTVVNGLIMGDIIMYTIGSLQKELLWMDCPPNHLEGCWGRNTFLNCSIDCLNESIKISSQVFYEKVFMRDFDLEAKKPSLGRPLLPRVVVIGIAWLVVFMIARTGISKYKKIIIMNCYIIGILLMIRFIVCCLAPGSVDGITMFFHINISSFFNEKAWFLTVFKVIELLAIYKASYSVYGSYMAPTAPSDILTIVVVTLHLVIVALISLLTFATLGMIAQKAKTGVSKLSFLYDQNNVSYLTNTLQAIGFLGAPQLWSVVHLTICLLTLLNNQVTEIDVIERCITDLHSRLRQYRNYTIGALCLFGLTINVLLQSKNSYVLLEAIILNITSPIHPYEMAIFYALICWIYGVQRFSDDIHFLTLSQPARFWKICWYLLPGILVFVCLKNFHSPEEHDFPVLSLIFTCIYIGPIPIVAITTIFHYVKQHNLPGLIQMQERWGPPDPQERRVRHLFNPREEIRSRRRNDACKHKCIFSSRVLNQATEQEDDVRMFSRESDVTLAERSRKQSGLY